jgi:hypothetical protein
MAGSGSLARRTVRTLTQNMSHKQWREWISPDIDYIEACPGVPIAPDGSR